MNYLKYYYLNNICLFCYITIIGSGYRIRSTGFILAVIRAGRHLHK